MKKVSYSCGGINQAMKITLRQKKTLIESTVTVCGICLQEEDRSDDTTVEWIECTKCGIWIHTYCCKTKISDEYICTNCSDYA